MCVSANPDGMTSSRLPPAPRQSAGTEAATGADLLPSRLPRAPVAWEIPTGSLAVQSAAAKGVGSRRPGNGEAAAAAAAAAAGSARMEQLASESSKRFWAVDGQVLAARQPEGGRAEAPQGSSAGQSPLVMPSQGASSAQALVEAPAEQGLAARGADQAPAALGGPAAKRVPAAAGAVPEAGKAAAPRAGPISVTQKSRDTGAAVPQVGRASSRSTWAPASATRTSVSAAGRPQKLAELPMAVARPGETASALATKQPSNVGRRAAAVTVTAASKEAVKMATRGDASAEAAKLVSCRYMPLLVETCCTVAHLRWASERERGRLGFIMA